MPESEVRKEATTTTEADKPTKADKTDKKAADKKATGKPDKKSAGKRKREHDRKSRTSKARMLMSTRDWVPWVFIPLGLLGVLWLIVFYVAGPKVPVMRGLTNWNYLIGLGLIAASFVTATLWK